MNDVELGPEERSVIAAARDALDPTEMQRARVLRGLDLKIAAGVAAPLLVSSTALATVLKVGAAAVLTAALGSSVAYVARAPVEPRAPVPAAVASRPKPTAPAVTTLEVPAQPVAPVATPAEPGTVAAHPRPSVHHHKAPAPAPDFAGELDLLTRANAATQAGDATRAFDLLRAYDRSYPQGSLIQERVAAGVLAQCAAGRIEAAREEARRFFQRWPRSPLVARIRSSCAENAAR